MTDKEVIQKANEILLEALDPYVMFPKWAEIVVHLDELHGEHFSGIREVYHEKPEAENAKDEHA